MNSNILCKQNVHYRTCVYRMRKEREKNILEILSTVMKHVSLALYNVVWCSKSVQTCFVRQKRSSVMIAERALWTMSSFPFAFNNSVQCTEITRWVWFNFWFWLCWCLFALSDLPSFPYFTPLSTLLSTIFPNQKPKYKRRNDNNNNNTNASHAVVFFFLWLLFKIKCLIAAEKQTIAFVFMFVLLLYISFRN